jgi:rod shape-determining protein MreD
MKKFTIFTLTALIALTVFTLLLRYFPFIDTKPDIILIMVIYIAVAFDKDTDIFLAFALGYLHDVFSGCAVGLFVMLRIVAFVVTRFLNMNFFSKNALFFVVITFFISVFDSIYLGYQFKTAASGFLNILGNALYLSVVNAITALFMYPLFIKLEEIYLKTVEEPEGRH